MIRAHLLNKQYMDVFVNDFTDGVLGDSPLMFGGKIELFSSKRAIYANLPTSYDYSLPNKSQKTDVFHWTSGDVAIEADFERFAPGEFAYRLKMQHSTGRFVEDTITLHVTGKCIRIPNGIMTPEEEYGVLPNDVEKTPVASATPNSSLPPNTKIVAESQGGSITSEQALEDAKYCYQNPSNSLKASDGEVDSCSEVNAIVETRVKACKSKGLKDNPENCKGFLKWFKDLKAGRL